MAEKTYTVGEMARRLGVAPSTLRYYDREGLLPFLQRTAGGMRAFREADYEWLQMIACLKRTGMPLSDIRHFVQLAMQGDESIEERLALIVRQRAAVEAQLCELQDTLRVLSFKEWYYATAREHGTTAVPRDMPDEQLPEAWREVRQRLRGGNAGNV